MARSLRNLLVTPFAMLLLASCAAGSAQDGVPSPATSSETIPEVPASAPASGTAAGNDSGVTNSDDEDRTAHTGTAGTAGYAVGDVGPGGGIVFYVAEEPFPCGEDLTASCRYLEAAPVESEVTRAWAEETYAEVKVDGATGTAIGTGMRNTREIVAQGNTDPAGSAAAYADAYEHGGLSDWYLPSRDECHELTIARELLGGFLQGVYWTSTGRGSTEAWYQHFMNSFQFTEGKSTAYQVRPIRAF